MTSAAVGREPVEDEPVTISFSAFASAARGRRLRRRLAGTELDITAAIEGDQPGLVGLSPFSNGQHVGFTRYRSAQRRSEPSDRWTFEFAKLIEDIFSATSGGVFFIMFVYLIIYLLISFFWTLLLSIDGVEMSITGRNFGEAFSPLNFIVALIARDWIDGSWRKIIDGVRLYRKMYAAQQKFHNDIHSVFRSQFIELQKLFRTGVEIDPDLGAQWVAIALESIQLAATTQQLLALYSLRVFLKSDDELDYSEYGLTEDELAWARQLPLASYGVRSDTPSAIVSALLRTLGDTVQGISSKFERPLPSINQAQMRILTGSLDNLNRTAEEVESSRQITEPGLFRKAYVVIIGVYLLVLVPVIIFSSVDIYTVLVGPVVLFLYTLLLLLRGYVGSPFDDDPRWIGPDFYGWRTSLYASIYHDEKKERRWVRKAGVAIAMTPEERADYRIVVTDNLAMFKRAMKQTAG